MTRPYALCMLLEHGPLTHRELMEVTGWSIKTVRSALRRSMKRGWVTTAHMDGCNRLGYRLA